MIQFPEISMLPVSYIKQGSVIFSSKYILAYVIGSPYAFPHVTPLHFSSSSAIHTFCSVLCICICEHTQKSERLFQHTEALGTELLWGGWGRGGNVAGTRWLWQAQGQEQGEKFLGFAPRFSLLYFSLHFLAALSHAQHYHQQHPLEKLCIYCNIFVSLYAI